MATFAAGILWLGVATSGQAAAQIAATSPAMATVTVPPASEEPPPPPPLESADAETVEAEAEEAASDELAWPPEPGPVAPADYRADLFAEPQPETETDLPATPQPPTGVSNPANELASEPSAPGPRPAQTVTLPAGSGLLDSATAQRAIDRLVALHFLASPADAQNPDLLVQAIKDFQASIGISPSGTMDRDTVGRLTLP